MHTIQSLTRALHLTEKIDALKAELSSLLGNAFGSTPAFLSPKGTRRRRKLSAEAREKIAAAQRRRWSKAKGEKASPPSEKPAKKRKKRKMSPEGLQRIKDAQAKRWAAVKAKAGK